jgi:hypothetical protein
MALPEERLRVAPIDRTAAVAQPYQTTRVSWGGVWSGVLVAVGVLLLLGSSGWPSAPAPSTSARTAPALGVWGLAPACGPRSRC